MPRRSYGRQQRHHTLSIREREILIYRYANPELTHRQLSRLLNLLPGELTRLLRLKEGVELHYDLIATRAPNELWPEFRLEAPPPPGEEGD